jgi:SnoaL-like domain
MEEIFMRTKSKYSAVAMLSAIGVVTMASTPVRAVEVPADLKALQKYVQRHQDYIEIQNLMGLRAHYHAVSDNMGEFALWARRPDIVWGTAAGYRIGYEHVREQYTNGIKQQQARLEAMSKAYPEIKNSPENLAVGTLITHALETPIIEVAGDGKTAKAVWHTFGPMVNSTPDKGFTLTLAMEKYGVDFIKENGQWRIWHAIVVNDFNAAMGQPLSVPKPPVANQGQQGPVEGTILPRDIKVELYKQMSPTVTPQIFPKPPVPYQTFSETFSYGPTQDVVEAFLKEHPQKVVD